MFVQTVANEIVVVTVIEIPIEVEYLLVELREYFEEKNFGYDFEMKVS